jgi:hypothetical protein
MILPGLRIHSLTEPIAAKCLTNFYFVAGAAVIVGKGFYSREKKRECRRGLADGILWKSANRFLYFSLNKLCGPQHTKLQ